MPIAKNFQSGDQLGRYELVFPAGKGGMGQVWAAKLRGSQGFRKIVALKTLLASEAFSDEMQRMLRDEAMLASYIKSPHVAETLDFDLHEGVPYLVMEWVDGESLADLLEELEGPLSLKHVVAIATQVCKGLDATHKARDAAGKPLGLVHRDVSPPNVLISYSGTVKLADFGIAKVTGTEELNVETGLKGKFSFMAPEQIRGGSLDARTDIFAMSVLLYRLVTLRYPFAGADAGETLWQISSSITPPSPRLFNENLPPRVEEVILKGLEKEPEDRFQSAEEMRLALERAVPPNLRGNSESTIAELMQETLGERMEQRRRETARALLSMPPGPIDKANTPHISTLKGLTLSKEPSSVATIDVTQVPPRRRRRSTAALSLLGGFVLTSSLALGYALTRAPEAPRLEPAARAARAPLAQSELDREGHAHPVRSAPAPSASAPAAPSASLSASAKAPEPEARAPEPKPASAPRSAPRDAVVAPRRSEPAGGPRALTDSARDLKAPY